MVLPIVVPTTMVVDVEEPPTMGLAPSSFACNADFVQSHYPRQLSLIPSAMEEFALAIPAVRLMATTVSMPTATMAPISVPTLPSLVDL